MAVRYEYFKIGRRYFCLQQSPLTLFWLLYIRSLWSRLGTLRVERATANAAIRSLVSRKLRRRGADIALVLPFYGDIALPVHGGYKLFDLRRNSVVKFFSSDVDEMTVDNEIEAVRAASHLSFAPSIPWHDAAERCYGEDFVAGDRAYVVISPEKTSEFYFRYVAPCIAEMLQTRAPEQRSLREYLDSDENNISKNNRIEEIHDATARRTIDGYLHAQIEWLQNQDDQPVSLIFSHGDFSLRNILVTAAGIAVIDWEDAAKRSVLSDLYNFFLTELYYERITMQDVQPLILDAISSLAEVVRNEDPALADTLISSLSLYRRLYYLERILVLTARELSDSRLPVILRSIETFKAFERATGHDGGS